MAENFDARELRLDSSMFDGNNGTSTIYARDGPVSAKDCSIINNLGPYDASAAGVGGGINCWNCTVLIENCTVRNNTARMCSESANKTMHGWSGAGICLSYSDAVVNDTVIEGNGAVGGCGIFSGYSKLVTNRGTLNKNIAWTAGRSEGVGGGISTYGGQVTLNGVTIGYNRADTICGAISNDGDLKNKGS